jgi:hypothetical protein
MPAGYTLWVLRHRSSKDECIAIDDYQLEVVRKEDRLIRNAETRQKAAAI